MTNLLTHAVRVHGNLPTVELIERSLILNESTLGSDGQLCVRTGVHTGRAANDKYIVDRPETTKDIEWGPVGRPLSVETFENLKVLVKSHLTQKEVFVIDFTAGGARCRLITELAWQAVFVSNLFKRLDVDATDDRHPDLTIVAVPSCEAIPLFHKTRSSTFVALDLKQGLCLIGGTGYAGEIKKTVFTFLSWALPNAGVLPMHSSVTVDHSNGRHSAVFFGLSGTGKTTLSADWRRQLLGDDEHGWSFDGLFNFEAGCYAKALGLGPYEPEILNACERMGTVLENVVVNPDRTVDFSSARYAENTRAAYPLSYIKDSLPHGSIAGHPETIIMLTCDAFGVLPSFARLSPDAAIYHFLSGYTAKVAGTERGVTEPTATFSTCFGAPFMPHHPNVYATLLRRFIDEHKPRIYLVNTGWAGGPAGVGKRMALDYTRGVVRSILEGDYDQLPTTRLLPFNLDVPIIPEGVLSHHHLNPMLSWSDPAAYDAQSKKLVQLFNNNFTRFNNVSESVKTAGPSL